MSPETENMAHVIIAVLSIAAVLAYVTFVVLNRLHFTLSKKRSDFWTGIALKELIRNSWELNEYELRRVICKRRHGELAWRATLKLIVREGYATPP